MKRNSITFKLFIITTIFFILFLMIVVISQSMFFEKFYINHKISKLEKNLEGFAKKYYKEGWDQITITKNISNFINNNNAQIAILDDKAITRHIPLFNLIIETEDKNEVMVPLNNMILMETIQKLNLSIGDPIVIKGVYSNNEHNIIYPSSIQGKGNSLEVLDSVGLNIKENLVIDTPGVTGISEREILSENNSIQVLKKTPTSFAVNISNLRQEMIRIDMREIKGNIVELNFPTQKDFIMSYREDMFWSAMDNWFWISKSDDFAIENEEIISYKYKSPMNGIDNIVMIKPIFDKGELKEMVFAMSSLQPVGEAIGVMKDYYIYGFLVAILIIIILSYIYSKLIANPLIKINNTAIKMAELDFSVECNVKSNDEIGNLANSINILASNLNKNMKTLQDTNEKLRVEIEKERTLERMRKEFVSSASHELKTPLGIMRGFTEGLKDEVAIEKKDYYIDVILEEIEKMDTLVLDMLDLSKLESKAYLLAEENFYIDSLMQLVKNRFIQQLKEKDIKVNYMYSAEEIMVRADKKRIEQVITNIISNAIRHTKLEGFINIGIRKYNEDKIYITVENEGDRIQEDKLNHIWDRFYRVEESRDREFGGTGLGLSIVKNILELHNSDYGVKNTENGVMLYFTLRLAVEKNYMKADL
ncbi:HAMP domain-containing histidine kinase [Alkaliphilus sp. MSJ-5]|uniref:histidine kinase n=1 Tax=Alkaliphilus flagellatus TaxID=2841507 RepID=A0ABS6FY33_9FIRM|nr:HAMP domain-containing sensor histidine kinase [Alkaliphilus flagellatus]MBU5674899.1 HAMP domain-containing histidine kinase [Alkaliphilus flagellatus]